MAGAKAYPVGVTRQLSLQRPSCCGGELFPPPAVGAPPAAAPPRTKRAFSMRSISYGDITVTQPDAGVRDLDLRVESDGTSWVTTTKPCASAWATS